MKHGGHSGHSGHSTLKLLRPQLLVATPGRLNDLLEPPAGRSGQRLI